MSEDRVWNDYISKKVYLMLKNGRNYTGVVCELDKGIVSFICINDKFGKKICIATSEIVVIQEES